MHLCAVVAIVICVAIIDGGMKNRNLFNLGKIRIVDNFLIAVVSSYAPPAIHITTADQVLFKISPLLFYNFLELN